MNELNQFTDIVKYIENKSLTDLQATLKLVLGDSKSIFIDGYQGKVSINSTEEAECTLILSEDDMKLILSGQLNPASAFMQGKVKVEGDMSVAMKLQGFFN